MLPESSNVMAKAGGTDWLRNKGPSINCKGPTADVIFVTNNRKRSDSVVFCIIFILDFNMIYSR
jgi:hypothetical protein